MSGHHHGGGADMTQNQGNQLGDRPCVRQSRLYREHVGGNTMKGLLGQDSLKWDTQNQQGAYAGKKVFDHNDEAPNGAPQEQIHGFRSQEQPAQGHQAGNQQTDEPAPHRRGAGQSNKSSYNILSHN